jgi:protein-S-isoprenylcysteine O-methyltransferase Ste14
VSKTEKAWKRDPVFWTYSILLSIPVVTAFMYHNQRHLDALVHTGYILMAVGVTLVLAAGYEFKKRGGAPKGESIVHTTALVDTGVYSIIRHPQYLGFMIITLGLVLTSQHWASIASAAVGTALFYLDIKKEEQLTINKLGEPYRLYMQRVSALNPLPGTVRLIRDYRKR